MTCKCLKFRIFRIGDSIFFNSDDSTQICACHNVTKGDVVENLKSGTCKNIGEVKSCTKAGTGCGGCMPLVQSIFNKTMLEMGQEVSNHCEFVVQNSCDRFDLTFGSVCPHPIFTRRSLQHRRYQAVENIRRCDASRGKEARLPRL